MDSTATARERETWKHRLVCLAVAGAWLLPAGAAAQEDAFTLEADEETRPSDPEVVRELTEVRSEVEVGVGFVDEDSYKFGKYTGLERQGGFTVIDLGVDVSAEKYLEAIQEQQPDIVAMSALLSTTKNSMPVIIQALKDAGVRSQVRIMVGGAPITQEYCDRIGADGYAPDAASAVRRAKELLA